jgi:DNA-binding NtrC family response regulator
MGLLTQISDSAYEAKPPADLTLKAGDMGRILIVGEPASDTDRLKALLSEAGLAWESADTMTAGCESATSGRFGVVFSSPFVGDGSWRRLIEVAKRHRSSFEIVLLARNFDLNEWAEAMQVGAFDVLDVLFDLPRAAEVAQRAFGATYLKRFRTRASQV